MLLRTLNRYGLHYNVLLQMIMWVLQEGKGLTKKLYFIILPVGRPVSMQKFRLNVYTVYLFWHRYSLHYNVLSGLIIISFSRSKRVNGKIICLCTRSEENLFSCKISSLVLPSYWVTLLHEEEEDEEEDEDKESVKISISYLMWHFHLFLHAVTFLHVLHLDVLRDRLRLKLKVKLIFPYV